MKPGTYRMSMADYLAIPAVSAGIIRETVERCPYAGWFQSPFNPEREPDFSDATDAGTIAHEILLEGSQDCVCVIDPNDHPAEKTGAIPNGWTNKSIRAARDEARLAGKIPVLTSDMVEITGMVDSARKFIDSLRTTEPAIWRAFQPDGGESELTLVWNDNGVLCRSRSDRISTDRTIIADLKSTARSAEPSSWARSQLFGLGYHMSAAFYRRGVRFLFDENPDYVFLVVECEPPYLCSLVGIEPSGLALAEHKVERGLALWRQCAADKVWPAYPNRVAYVEAPAWEIARLEAEQGNSSLGIPYDVSKLFRKSTEART